VNTGSTWQFAKGKCKESAANQVSSHNVSTNSNLLLCKSIYMQHERTQRRCTNILSIQDSKRIATRLLAALNLTCLVSTYTSNTSTDSRPITFKLGFNSRMKHMKNKFCLARILV
jgi:hypothetical protein